MNCREVSERVSDYLDRQLPLATRLRIRLHLGRCSHCRCFYRQVRHTVKLLGCLPKEPLCGQTHDELIRCFREWRD